jgi:hypothetical protein
MDPQADIVCQWCKSVVAVNTRLGEWLVVRENAEHEGKHYCIGEGGGLAGTTFSP